MFRVLSCLGGEHDWRLVALAAIVCLVASLAAVNLIQRARMSDRGGRAAWIATAGAGAGCGIWATHFIAMLAYQPGVAVAYDVGLTFVSLVVAMAVTAAGIGAAVSGSLRSRAIVGGAVIGAGVAAMHYLGMSALEVGGHLTWSPGLVAASIALGMVSAIAAMTVTVHRTGPVATLLAAVLLAAAIVSLHFTAMGAVTIVPNALRVVTPSSISPSTLAVAVAAISAVVMAIAAVCAMLDDRLRKKSIQLDSALDHMVQGLKIFDAEGRLVLCNRRYTEMYGLPAESVRPGLTLHQLQDMRAVAGSFTEDPASYIAAMLGEANGAAKVVELPNGRTITVINQRMAGGGWISTHEDVTERARAEAQINHMATHDGLTGLPNRACFQLRMEQTLLRVARGDTYALLCIDLDGFKSVNDTFGHPVGDLVLQTVGQRLRHGTREMDSVARFGGDEFAVLQVGVGRPEDAATLAQRLIEAISAPYDVDGQQIVIGASIGVAMAPDDGPTSEALLRNADLALYRAKANGRMTYAFFEPAMDAQLRARHLLEVDLRKALGNGELDLAYQPLVNLASGRISSCEALLRWSHPQRGMVSPGEFIPLAEDIGLIVPIGEWVLRRACSEAMSWPSDVSVAVNLSAVQFKCHDLVETVVDALAQSGLPGSRLELEITESVLLHESLATTAVLHRLHALGIRISMDDFGTGYSSLSYLRSFPFDKLKIDQSFLRDLSGNADCAAIVKAVADLGRAIGVVTTAEGVETAEQLEMVRLAGCTEAQGFYFYVPRAAAATRELLAQRARELHAA
ncbi:MAG: EAL domain-containing protein [Xanthobacteraceae bacterium]